MEEILGEISLASFPTSGSSFPQAKAIEEKKKKKGCFRTQKQQRNKLFPIATGNQLTFERGKEKLREFIIRNVDNFETSRKPSLSTALLLSVSPIHVSNFLSNGTKTYRGGGGGGGRSGSAITKQLFPIVPAVTNSQPRSN